MKSGIKNIFSSNKKGQQQQALPPPQQTSSASSQGMKRANKSAAGAAAGAAAVHDTKRQVMQEDPFKEQKDALRRQIEKLISDAAPKTGVDRYSVLVLLARVEWKLAKLEYPNDLIQLEAARKALVDAEVRQEREVEKMEIEKQKQSAMQLLPIATGELKEKLQQQLLDAITAESSGSARETELRKKFEATYKMPSLIMQQSGPLQKMTWKEISKVIDDLPFVQNVLLEDDESHLAVLGPLYRPGGAKWPVVKEGMIDMRLASVHFFDPNAKEDFRPAAKRLIAEVKNAATNAAFVLIGVPGVGKSSALIDLGRVHYIIFIQASVRMERSGIAAMARKSREMDLNFVEMFTELNLQTQENATNAERHANWMLAVRRCKVELVARTLQLVRLKREVGSALSPWMFTIHQLAGTQDFAGDLVKILLDADEKSLDVILRGAMKELQPIFTEKRKLVVAVDEIELASYLLRDRFTRPEEESAPGAKTTSYPKGIISPLCRAISNLSPIAKWSVVLAGTGASEQRVANLKTDLGKASFDGIISDAPAFPLTRDVDVVHLIGRLNISDELRALLTTGIEATPLHEDARYDPEDDREFNSLSHAEQVICLLEDYAIGTRFRVLCSAIEHIPKVMRETWEGDRLLVEGLKISIEKHADGLVELLTARLDSNHPNGLQDETVVDTYLENLLRITVAVKLTDGKSRVMKLTGLPSNASDLTRLGIAAASYTGKENQKLGLSSTHTAYTVCERFVVNALESFFESAHVRERAVGASAKKFLGLLRNVIQMFGAQSSFKGNVLERLILERLVQLHESRTRVVELPFFPRDGVDPSWNDFLYQPQGVLQRDNQLGTPQFLASVDASKYVYSPESVCRPDGIVMLPNAKGGTPRAISIGVALYSERVPKEKVVSQYWSTDLSRAYFNEDHVSYPATRKARKEWVEHHLHETIALRVHVYLPYAPAAGEYARHVHKRETTVEGSQASARPQRKAISHPDVIVNIDRSNLHLLLGDSDEMKQVYELLKVATGVTEGWCVRNNVDSSE